MVKQEKQGRWFFSHSVEKKRLVYSPLLSCTFCVLIQFCFGDHTHCLIRPQNDHRYLLYSQKIAVSPRRKSMSFFSSTTFSWISSVYLCNCAVSAHFTHCSLAPHIIHAKRVSCVTSNHAKDKWFFKEHNVRRINEHTQSLVLE